MIALLRIAGIVLALAVLAGAAIVLSGIGPDPRIGLGGAIAYLRGTGGWAWAVGLLLLVADVILPVPSTVVMSALGVIYGPWAGGALAALGSFLAGMTAYGLCRLAGPRAARILAGRRGMARARALFRRWGGGLVTLSRWVPVLPETVSCLAGLARMPAPRFTLALALGSGSIGPTFAALGHYGAGRPFLVLVAAALLPLGIWLAVAPRLFGNEAGLRRRGGGRPPPR